MTSMPSGIKLAAWVGIPNPRLIPMPSLNSLATLKAIVCSSSRSFILSPLPHRPAGDIDAWRNDNLRVKAAQFHQFIHLNDGHFGRARHHGIKVAGSTLVNTVAVAVGAVGPHQSEIGLQGILQYMVASIDNALFLAFFQDGAGAGGDKKRPDTRFSRPDSFRQRSLRNHFYFQFSSLPLFKEGRRHTGSGHAGKSADGLFH